jgi:hypothetical protein
MYELTEPFLTTWDDAWRFPEIWARFCRQGLVDLDTAASAVIAARAVPCTAVEVWRQLLAQGEFQAAEELFEIASFLSEATSDGCDAAFLASELTRERQRALHELTLRAELATARAERLEILPEMKPKVQQALRAAALYSDGARALLEGVETELSRLAAERHRELEEILVERSTAADRTPAPALVESIDRCLAVEEFRVAAALLADGDVEAAPVPSPHLQLLLRSGTWPYRHEKPQVVVGWFQRRGWAPPGFSDRWAPPRLDIGWTLLDELAALLAERANTTPESVGQIAQTLTRYFGGPAVAPVAAQRRGGLLWSTIQRVGSWWLPALAARYGSDLTLAVPDPQSGESPRAEELAGLVVLLDPWNDVWPVPPGTLRLPIELLLQGMPEPGTRRAFLMRELGAQIPLAWLLPAELPERADSDNSDGSDGMETLARRFFLDERHSMMRTSLQTTRDLVNVFLEISGVEVEHGEDLDLLAFYSGARPTLVGNLLRRLFERLAKNRRSGRRAVSRRLVEEVWRDPEFRRSALDLLLPPPDASASQLVLGALVYEILTDRASSRTKPVALFSLADTAGLWQQDGLDAEELAAALADLRQRGLVDGSEEEGFVLDHTGVGMLVSEALAVDIDAYMERAAARRSQGRAKRARRVA